MKFVIHVWRDGTLSFRSGKDKIAKFDGVKYPNSLPAFAFEDDRRDAGERFITSIGSLHSKNRMVFDPAKIFDFGTDEYLDRVKNGFHVEDMKEIEKYMQTLRMHIVSHRGK